jgi:galactokinase
LVAQSLVAADKHVTAPVCFNLRVVECSLAARVLASLIDLRRPLPSDESPLGVSLRGLQEAYFDEMASTSATDRPTADEPRDRLQIMLGLSKTLLTNVNGYTRQEIGDMLGQPVDELEDQYMAKCPVRAERFHLRQRAVHVFSEAIRVLDFKDALSSPEEKPGQTPTRLGDLMNQSQSSCRELFDCSCPELDEICHIALQAGAYGSRLTGAGWGGSTVHLVPQERVGDIRKALELHYYKKRFPAMTEQQLADAIVVSKPANGSFVLVLSGNRVQ